ncbi:MAG: phage tail protein [Caldilineaceae bacterium]
MSESTRSRLLQYLPAIFQEPGDKGTPPFLYGFLQPFEYELAALEALLAELDLKFSPAMTPTDEFLPWLATWVALVLDEEWPPARRRQLLSEAVELYRWRGTVQGLKRYLAIYTGIDAKNIVIHEAQQPAGMQIGVSSRIGIARPVAGTALPNEIETLAHDDYVVDTAWPTDLPATADQSKLKPGDPVQLRYAASQVTVIDIDADDVDIWHQPADKPKEVIQAVHARPAGAPQPNIDRLNEQIEYATARRGADGASDLLQGGAFLVERIDAAYCFVVEVCGTPAELDRFVPETAPDADDEKEQERRKERAKFWAILELEKPAHTRCFLKFTPIPAQAARPWMQIEVHSTVGLDTAIG